MPSFGKGFYIVVISAFGVVTIGKERKKLDKEDDENKNDSNKDKEKLEKEVAKLKPVKVFQDLKISNTTNLDNTTVSDRIIFLQTREVEIYIEKIEIGDKNLKFGKKEEEQILQIVAEPNEKNTSPKYGVKKFSGQSIPEEYFSNSDEKLNSHKNKVPLITKNSKSNKNSLKDEYIHLRKSTVYRENNNPDMSMTMLNIVNDLKLIENINRGVQNYRRQHQEEELEDDEEEDRVKEMEKGYASDNDEDFDLEGPFLPEEESSFHAQGDLSQWIIDPELRDSIKPKAEKGSNNLNEITGYKKISTDEELKNLLFNPESNIFKKHVGANLQIQTETKKISDKEEIEIILPSLLLIILKYLYSELHSGLVELSDTFVEQRRLFFEKDMKAYLAIIKYFLNKKGEFFLGVLSTIMSALNISQVLLDNTFIYYMNYADQQDEKVQQIRMDYDKVYSAGIKKTIAPRNLNKNKLKEILEFQCQKYEELIDEFKEETCGTEEKVDPMDIIEVIVVDYTYLEFGFDREAVKAAEAKHHINEDPEFQIYLNKLSEFQKDAFLNI